MMIFSKRGFSMNLQDATRNQHFVSQVEQRLNAVNPHAKKEDQKIYSFSLHDRESYSISLDSEKGFKISNNLSLNDVFGFEVLEKEAARHNFEKLFHQYEKNIKSNTDSLLSKIANPRADVKKEVLEIFLSKFLNFVRNPYSIKKVLNTFPQLKNMYPTNSIHYKNYKLVLNGRKPQQTHLCNQLGISGEEYATWLSVIFLLLTALEDDQPNFLEKVVKRLYESSEIFVMVIIYTYHDETCLLSDRGYSSPLTQEQHMVFDFNLYSHGFIRYVFGDINFLVPENTSKELLGKFKMLRRSISIHNIVNDLSALEIYNKHVVYQCHQKIFNSSKKCYGIF